MKLKYITFIFENCDDITIEGKYIGNFLVDNIQTSIQRVASNAINKIVIANTFAIEIHKDANKERYQHNQTHIENFKQMSFDRFTQFQDITAIKFELISNYEEDQETETYDFYLNWKDGEDSYTNSIQKTYISNCGHLYIVVDDKLEIFDYFDKEKINDSPYMEFSMEMCGVGDKYSKENYNE